LEEFRDCTYVVLPEILPEIIKEELGHIGFGTNQTAELAAQGDEPKEKVQRAVNFWYLKAPRHVRPFAVQEIRAVRLLGIKRRTNAQARKNTFNKSPR
jgi:1,2-phenylacetyl-CoA epoxidase catalytic subunit